ncbi:HNH endonuclease [Paenibacillus sp. YYML68]|uniref:HNH endonuclease n=1 Tax=Paenibacillus sp. YYML68 TaxID=2909250 RepID=UPI002490DB73|nr:HNH endonuclease [Paenibacillus sp. YYML68]
MEQDQQHSESQESESLPEPASVERAAVKLCAHCKLVKPIGEFLRRTGKRAGKASRRGACRTCRKQRSASAVDEALQPDAAKPSTERAKPDAAKPSTERAKPDAAKPPMREPAKPLGLHAVPAPPEDAAAGEAEARPRLLQHRPLPVPPPRPKGPDAAILRPTREGVLWMLGRTDKGRRWRQETDLETAVTLVNEFAAVVVNRYTVKRLYSNKSFRQYILTRDAYTCHFCGQFGNTIDHLLPRSKGGHTTPVNCVCACNECNQSKASQSVEEFIQSGHDDSHDPAHSVELRPD